MENPNQPNVALSLFAFHHVITRAINVSIENGARFLSDGFPDPMMLDGYAKYVRTLSEVIYAHHEVEDALAFPYFKERIPEAPYDRLMQEHQKMLPLLEQINQGALQIRDEQTEKEGLTSTNEAVQIFSELWHPHIQIEENHFDPPKLAKMLPVEEHLRLITEFGQFSQQHSSPASLIMPFILYNLSAAERAGMEKALPPEVVENLVPRVWKPEWEPMSPFLDI
jgi:hemerythrin-like domain-containing protein